MMYTNDTSVISQCNESLTSLLHRISSLSTHEMYLKDHNVPNGYCTFFSSMSRLFSVTSTDVSSTNDGMLKEKPETSVRTYSIESMVNCFVFSCSHTLLAHSYIQYMLDEKCKYNEYNALEVLFATTFSPYGLLIYTHNELSNNQ